METRKEAILAALDAFTRQRAGLEFGNYGDVKAYRAEQRSITKDLHQYRELAAAVRRRDDITADMLLEAARSAYSGRLTLTEQPAGKTVGGVFLPSPVPGAPSVVRVDYCTGQYFPTEYRRAACAVLASALWSYTREHAMPAPNSWRVRCMLDESGDVGDATRRVFDTREAADHYAATVARSRSPYVQSYHDGKTPGDWLRAYFRKEFGRGIAARWFN